MRPRLMNLIPTYMRYRQVTHKTLHLSAQQSQSWRPAKLFRLFKQQLHAHANAEHRSSFGDALDDKAIEAALRESLHASAECADAWQDQGLCFAENVRLIADNCLRPGRRECFLERAQIAASRAHFERAFPKLEVVWLSTSAGDDQVLLVTRDSLIS